MIDDEIVHHDGGYKPHVKHDKPIREYESFIKSDMVEEDEIP